MNRIESQEILTLTVNWCSTRVSRPFSGEKIVISTHDAVTTGEPHAKEESWTPTSHYIQKLSKNEL